MHPSSRGQNGAPQRIGNITQLNYFGYQSLQHREMGEVRMKKKQIPRSTLWPDNPSGAGQSRSDDNKRKNPQPLHLIFSAQAPLALGRKGWATSWARRLRNDSG
jgi:hypothetical protein